jgi:hypothetical protein
VKQKRTWQEKLHDSKGFPRVSAVEGRMVGRWGTKAGDTFVIAAPLEVDELMRRVRRGKLITIDEMRTALARRHKATVACPVTTGIFAWIAAHAADEAEHAGKKRITPYWRTLKSNGELNPKYPGGIPALKRKLTAEGHRVRNRGKRHFVADFAEKLATL